MERNALLSRNLQLQAFFSLQENQASSPSQNLVYKAANSISALRINFILIRELSIYFIFFRSSLLAKLLNMEFLKD